jgi:hypothetical protein
METCKYCGKTKDIESEIDLGTSGKLLVFACGHSDVVVEDRCERCGNTKNFTEIDMGRNGKLFTFACGQEREHQAEDEAERDANQRQEKETNDNRIAYWFESDKVIRRAKIRDILREIKERD